MQQCHVEHGGDLAARQQRTSSPLAGWRVRCAQRQVRARAAQLDAQPFDVSVAEASVTTRGARREADRCGSTGSEPSR